MRKKFVPLAMLFALLGTLLLSGAAVANASTSTSPSTLGSSSWTCKGDGKKDGKDHVHCDKGSLIGGNLIEIIVSNINVDVSDVQLINIQNALNNTTININTSVGDIKNIVVVIFKNVGIIIIHDQVKVCKLKICS